MSGVTEKGRSKDVSGGEGGLEAESRREPLYTVAKWLAVVSTEAAVLYLV
jgi:hypothetical protein